MIREYTIHLKLRIDEDETEPPSEWGWSNLLDEPMSESPNEPGLVSVTVDKDPIAVGEVQHDPS